MHNYITYYSPNTAIYKSSTSLHWEDIFEDSAGGLGDLIARELDSKLGPLNSATDTNSCTCMYQIPLCISQKYMCAHNSPRSGQHTQTGGLFFGPER